MREALHEEQSYLSSHFEHVDPNIPFNANSSIMSIAHALKEISIETAEDTLSLLHHDSLQKSISMIDQASLIYVFGFSAYIPLAEVFQMKMSRIHKNVIPCRHIGEENYYAGLVTSKDLAILISYSGETPKILKVAKILKEKGIPMIIIISIGENSLSRFSETVLYMSTREKLFSKIANFTTEHSLSLLFDILYSGYFRLQYDKNLNDKVNYAKKVEVRHVSSNTIINEE